MPKASKLNVHLSTMRLSRSSEAERNHHSDMSSSEDSSEMEVEDSETAKPLNFNNDVTINDLTDLFELCKSKCPLKYLSTLVYATLRSFGVNWRNCDSFLRSIGKFLKYPIVLSSMRTRNTVFKEHLRLKHHISGQKSLSQGTWKSFKEKIVEADTLQNSTITSLIWKKLPKSLRLNAARKNRLTSLRLT